MLGRREAQLMANEGLTFSGEHFLERQLIALTRTRNKLKDNGLGSPTKR